MMNVNKSAEPEKDENNLILDSESDIDISDSEFLNLDDWELELEQEGFENEEVFDSYLDYKVLKKASDKLKSILEITRIMSSIHEPDKLFHLVLEKIMELSGAEKGCIILTDEKKELEFKSFRNYSQSEQLSIDKLISKTVLFNVVESKKAVLLRDAINTDVYNLSESIMRLDIHSIICVPLLFTGVCIGVIYLDNRNVNHFTGDDLEMLEVFAAQAASSIKNMMLINQINSQNEELEHLVKKRTAQLIKAQKKIARQEKLAGLAHIASGVAHYFNNMITGIMGNTDLLKMQGVKHTKQLNEIIKISQNLSRFTSSLQDFSSRKTRDKSSVDLLEVVDIILLLKKADCATGGIRIIDRTKVSGPIMLNGNKFDITHALMNVFSNSVEAFNRVKRAEKLIEVELSLEHGTVKLQITDNGCGIKEENLSSVYDPFFTTKGSISEGEHAGYGMGLSTTQKLIIDNGGHVIIDSIEGVRTTVDIYFTAVEGG